MSKSAQPFLTPRANETDEEARLREALCRHADATMTALDAAIRLRSADGATSRMRALTRTALQDACMRGMEAFHLSKS